MTSRLAPSALLLALLAPFSAMAQISVAINIRPPALPVYVQPPLPGEGYLWTPGYWGWSGPQNDYYWIPGTWVQPPSAGSLWTPGYWGYQGGGYRWRAGYWGPRVGFYGGIAYGHGYTGNGYHGGRWDRGAFYYNTSVNNVDKVVVRNVYKTTVVNNYNVKRVSFNGGPDGVRAEPTARERKEQQAKHVDPTPSQAQHERTAMATPGQRASVNHGSPPVAATAKPAQFDGQDKPRGDDDGDASQAQKKAANERRQAQAADAPQGKRDQKQAADAATTKPDDVPPATRDNAAKRAEPKTPQDATDGRSEPAKAKNEPRSQKQAEPQPQQDAQPQQKRQSQQQAPQQQRQEQPPQQPAQQREPPSEPQQKQPPKQQGKAQGDGGKDKARD